MTSQLLTKRSIQFSALADDNKNIQGLEWRDDFYNYRGLPYATMLAWVQAMEVCYANPDTTANAIAVHGEKGILTIDELGNFISWE